MRLTPSMIGNAAIALEHLNTHGEILVSDALLEESIGPWLEGQDDVLSCAVFGYGNCLRVLVQINRSQATVDFAFDLTPMETLWSNESQMLTFSYSAARVASHRFLSEAIDIATEEFTEAILKALLPNVVGLLAGVLVRRIKDVLTRNETESLLQRVDVQGVVFSNGMVTVDLAKVPGASEVLNTPLGETTWLPSTFSLPRASKMRLVDILILKSIAADRAGLRLSVTFTPIVKESIEAASLLPSAMNRLRSFAQRAIGAPQERNPGDS